MSQHMDALARANEIRLARAEFKREIKGGQVLLSEALAEPKLPEWLDKMLLEELLDSVPRLQTTAIHSMLHAASCRLTANVGDLTYRKRRVIAGMLSKWEARREIGKSGRRARPHSMARRRVHLVPLDSETGGQ